MPAFVDKSVDKSRKRKPFKKIQNKHSMVLNLDTPTKSELEFLASAVRMTQTGVLRRLVQRETVRIRKALEAGEEVTI